MAFKNLKMQLHRFQGVGGAALRELARLGCTVWEALQRRRLQSVLVLADPKRYHAVTGGHVGSLTKACLFSCLLAPQWLLLAGHLGSPGSLLPALSLAISLKLGPDLSA